MKIKEKIKSKSVKSEDKTIIYKCKKCGYENPRTFLNIFENEEYRYCSKCVHEFYESNFPKAILKK
jgi:uncharacterized Zn-finger protein